MCLPETKVELMIDCKDENFKLMAFLKGIFDDDKAGQNLEEILFELLEISAKWHYSIHFVF